MGFYLEIYDIHLHEWSKYFPILLVLISAPGEFWNTLTFKSIWNWFKQGDGEEEIKLVDIDIKWVKVKFFKIEIKIIYWLRKDRNIKINI